jgi:tetratricopeptide (TPR) repeat protein
MSRSQIQPLDQPKCRRGSRLVVYLGTCMVSSVTVFSTSIISAEQTAGPAKITTVAPAKMSPKEIVFLEAPPKENELTAGRLYGILQRELVRQSFLITARDEFGLRTRDASLGETAPTKLAAPQRLLVDSKFQDNNGSLIAVSQEKANAGTALLKIEVDSRTGQSKAIDRMLKAGDGWSRTEFAKILEQAGLPARKVAWRDESALPEKTEEYLADMSIVSQFAALRALHAELKKNGESPELLGAVVRAYANLGVLTEHLWIPDHKVFKARAWLYSERLMRRMSGDPWAVWHVAYADALFGHHGAAVDEVKDADARKTAKPRPEWVDLIEPYCSFQEAKLAKFAEKPRLRQLAVLLRFLAVESRATVRQTLDAADEVLKAAPDCTRVLDAACATGSVGNKHKATTNYLTAAVMVGKRLAEFPKLPAVVAALIENKAEAPAVLRVLAIEGDEDEGEPSWEALARILQEDLLVSIWHRARFMHDDWAVPVKEFLAEISPYIEDHPRKNAVLFFGLAQPSAADMAKMVQAIPIDNLELHHVGVLLTINKLTPTAFAKAANVAVRHVDFTYRDLAIALQHSTAKPQIAGYANTILELSPQSPVGISAVLDIDMTLPEKTIENWEKTEGHQAAVLRALGIHYAAMNRSADAERCLNASLKLSNDPALYRRLAAIAKAEGKMDQWKATLDESLKDQVQDLDHARVRVDIARYLMSQKKFREALPYSEAAAETWSEWGMRCAVQCHEGLEEWDKAELWIRRVSERYPSAWRAWHYWCLRVGKGNRQAAQDFADQYIANLPENRGADAWFICGLYFSGTGRAKEAVEAFEEANKQKPAGIVRLLAALACDELGDAKRRDELLKDIKAASVDSKLADLFTKALAKQTKDLDAKAVEEILKQAGANKARYAYIVGRFLDNRGNTKAANPYFDLAAQGNQRTEFDFVQLSTIRLAKEGLKPTAPEKKEKE